MSKPLYRYTIYGLTIQSELELSELIIADQFVQIDVFIIVGKVPEKLDTVHDSGLNFTASPNFFLQHIVGVGKYYVSNGNQIVIEPTSTTELDSLKVFLLTSALAVLLLQRKFFPIHGCAVEINDEGVIIAGNSGMGKSTVAYNFIQNNYKIISDDLSGVFIKDHIPIIEPGVPFIKLWKDTMIQNRMDTSQFENVRPGINKFKILSHECFTTVSRPFKHIYIIELSRNSTYEKVLISGVAKFEALIKQVYRFRFVNGLGLQQNLFSMATNFIPSIRMTQLNIRPDDNRSKRIMDCIINDLK